MEVRFYKEDHEIMIFKIACAPSVKSTSMLPQAQTETYSRENLCLLQYHTKFHGSKVVAYNFSHNNNSSKLHILFPYTMPETISDQNWVKFFLSLFYTIIVHKAHYKKHYGL